MRSLLRLALSLKLLPRRIYELRAKMENYAREKLERSALFFLCVHQESADKLYTLDDWRIRHQGSTSLIE